MSEQSVNLFHLPASLRIRKVSYSLSLTTLFWSVLVIIVSNGSYQPIDNYARTSSSAYPIYTDPTCRIHKILRFKSALNEGKDGDEKKDYMNNAGSVMSRVFGGIKGALGNLQHTPYIGPKSLNGGEVIISAGNYQSSLSWRITTNCHKDGQCEYIYRMQNTVDHTSVAELAKIIGIELVTSNKK